MLPNWGNTEKQKTHSKLSYPKHYGKDFVCFILSLSEYWN